MFVCTCLVSCTNTELDEFSQDELNAQVENGEVSFLYQGINYSCAYQRVNGEVLFDDKNVSTIVEVLKCKPNLVTFLHSDGTFEYFDNQEEFQESRSLDNTLLTKSSLVKRFLGGTLILYEKDNYKGDKWSMSVQVDGTKQIYIANVGKAWNDRISSFKLSCEYGFYTTDNPYPVPTGGCEVFFFEHENYGGASLVASTISSISIAKIKETPLFPGSKDNWNDRISSIKFNII